MKKLIVIGLLFSTSAFAQAPTMEDYQAAINEVTAQRDFFSQRATNAAVQLAAKDREIAKLKADIETATKKPE